MEARTRKGVAAILDVIEEHAPELTDKGHPVRRIIMRELHDICDINVQLADSAWDPTVDMNELWIMALSELDRAPEHRRGPPS
jgi:hypothetical protein